MYTNGKKVAITNVLGRYLRILLIFAGIALMIAACSKDDEEPKKDPTPKENPPVDGSQGGGKDTIVTPTDSLDADVVSQYLKLVNAAKIPGQPPAGVDGDIKIDVKDTIFLMRGLPVGDRVSFLHDPAVNVTGFYVYVPGSSYYYDVPSLPEEGRDSTDVVFIDTEFPVADFKDYPISFPLHIMPYVDGIPFDPFITTVQIQDPKDPDQADVCDGLFKERNRFQHWQWEYTIRLYNDEILNFWAPGIRVGINTLLGGCCRDDGVSRLFGDIGCSKIDSLRSPRQTWVEFPSNAGITSLYEVLAVDEIGQILIYGATDEATIVPDSRDFCTKTVELTYVHNLVKDGGEVTFASAGTGTGNGTLITHFGVVTQPNVSFLRDGVYNVEYTCNTMVLTEFRGEGEEWGFVYKRANFSEIKDFELEWYTYDDYIEL